MVISKWKLRNQMKGNKILERNQQAIYNQNAEIMKDMSQFRYETLTKLDLLLEDKESVSIVSENNVSIEDAKSIVSLIIDEATKIYPNDGTTRQSSGEVVLGSGIQPFTYGSINFDLLPEGVYMLTAKNKEVFTKKDGSWYINEDYKIVSNFSKGDTIKKLEELRDSIS